MAGEAGREIVAFVKDGVKFQASIGTSVGSAEPIGANKVVSVNGRKIKSKRPFHVARESELKEITILVFLIKMT